MTRFLPTSRRPVLMLASAGVALGMTLAGSGAASAATVEIQDGSGVLDTTVVRTDAATLPASVYIYTTTQDDTKSAFDGDVRGKVSAQFPITVGVNTGLRHSAVELGTITGLTPNAGTSAETAAVAAFDTTIRSTRSYTGAVTALLDSLKTSLAAALPTTTTATSTPATTTMQAATTTPATRAAATSSVPVPTPAAETAPPHSHGPGSTVIVVGIVVAVLMAVVLTDVFRRGRKTDSVSTNGSKPVSAREPVHQGASYSGHGDWTAGQDADQDKSDADR